MKCEPSQATQAEQSNIVGPMPLHQRCTHLRRRQCPNIAAATAATTATNLAITLTTATATATTTATATRMEMNNWDDAEIRGVAGCVLYISMQCW
jgi:hypothetical protein